MSLQSLENGRVLFERYCAACHGKGGLGDGPVSMTSPQQGPFGGVLPIAGPGEHREDPQRRTHLRDDPLRAPPHAQPTSASRRTTAGTS